MYGNYGKKRYSSKKGYKNKGGSKNYSKFGKKKHGTKTVITRYRW